MNIEETHWGKRILKALEMGNFTHADRLDSSKWITCACGKVDADIPRFMKADLPSMIGQPHDDELFELGNKHAMSTGLENTHWGRRITAAKKRGYFTGEDKVEAGDWVTCACGKATADIPRFKDPDSTVHNAPLDLELSHLGYQFHYAVKGDHPGIALILLERIELRAQVVAKENSNVR